MLKSPVLQQQKCALTPASASVACKQEVKKKVQSHRTKANVFFGFFKTPKSMTRILFLFKKIGSGSTQQGRKTNSQQNEAVPLNTKAADVISGQDGWLL